MKISESTERLQWSGVRDVVAGINPLLATDLDVLLTRKEQQTPFFKINYPYGAKIIDKGRLCIPSDVPPSSRQEVIEATSYSSIPLGIILDESIEVYVDCSRNGSFRSAPLSILHKGETFGVFEVLDSLLVPSPKRPHWSVTAGSVSIHVLAPIGDKRLTKYLGKDVNWSEEQPAYKLVQQVVGKDTWRTSVLLIPGSVIEKMKRNDKLFDYLLATAWRQSANLRASAVDDGSVLNAVADVVRKTSVPLGEYYHFETIRHLLNICTGNMPAFRSIDYVQNPAGPFRLFLTELNRALLNMKVTQYTPIVLQPAHLSEGTLGYYSFRCPSLPGPRMPNPREPFIAIAESFADIFNRLMEDDAFAVRPGDATFYARKGSVRRGLRLTADLSAGDFIQAGNGSGIYLDSPFLIAAVRLRRDENRNAMSTAAATGLAPLSS